MDSLFGRYSFSHVKHNFKREDLDVFQNKIKTTYRHIPVSIPSNKIITKAPVALKKDITLYNTEEGMISVNYGNREEGSSHECST